MFYAENLCAYHILLIVCGKVGRSLLTFLSRVAYACFFHRLIERKSKYSF